VVIYDVDDTPLWEAFPIDRMDPFQRLLPGATRRTPDAQYTLVMQHDGNLVLSRQDGTVEWASNTPGITPRYLEMQGDGNLVLTDTSGTARWTTGTNGHDGAYMRMGAADGILVIYRPDGLPLWILGWP
jgi:hypothetical protein